jgi:magnesium-transporting ATPase (P-type)
MQVFNVFVCRSSVKSVFATSLLDNRLIVWAVVVEIVLLLLIVYAPWGNALLGTAPVPPALWLVLLPFGVTMLMLEEVRKWVVRRHLRASTTNPPDS